MHLPLVGAMSKMKRIEKIRKWKYHELSCKISYDKVLQASKEIEKGPKSMPPKNSSRE
jgi:hypothetical protein